MNTMEKRDWEWLVRMRNEKPKQHKTKQRITKTTKHYLVLGSAE